MFKFLHAVCVAMFWTTFSSAEVKVESQGVGLLDLSLNGMVSNERLLFQMKVSSRLVCASACLKYSCCVAFSTSPKDPTSNLMTCRGHDSMSISQTSTVAAPGSKTYFMERGPSESSWLERPCTTNSDCPATVANVECFATAGQCLCKPGYYYSFCRDACVLDCAALDLQTTFLKYPGYAEYGNDLDLLYGCDEFHVARQHCIVLSNCRSFDIEYPAKICYLQSTTPLSPRKHWGPRSDINYFQRTCL